jgi:transposase
MEQTCSNVGVNLVYFPPYSPDLNPIKKFFAELKTLIKRSWSRYEEDPGQDFDKFLEWCVYVIGREECNARLIPGTQA